jgi:putative IMPACT (imprinted ancient) family translation regulator
MKCAGAAGRKALVALEEQNTDEVAKSLVANRFMCDYKGADSLNATLKKAVNAMGGQLTYEEVNLLLAMVVVRENGALLRVHGRLFPLQKWRAQASCNALLFAFWSHQSTV